MQVCIGVHVCHTCNVYLTLYYAARFVIDNKSRVGEKGYRVGVTTYVQYTALITQHIYIPQIQLSTTSIVYSVGMCTQ